MPIPTGILTPIGLEASPLLAESLAEAAAQEPNGVYTVARTFKRDHTLMLNDHLSRLEQSAALVGLNVTLDRAALRNALRTLIEPTNFEDTRFRITIPQETPERIYIAIERYKPVPPEILAGGARCVTIQMARHNPAAKTTAWIAERRATVEAFPAGIYEGILVNEAGDLLEGTSSNFYAIMDDCLHTAPDGAALGGIAQRIVLTVAPEVLPVERTAVNVSDLRFLEEAFITSAGRGVVPVIMVDGQVIAAGQPGPFTLAIRERYDAWADAHLEPL